MVQAHQTSSNLLELYHRRDNKVCRVFSHGFRVVGLYGTFIVAEEIRCAGCSYTSWGRFKVLRTSSNLLEPHHQRDSKVWRVMSSGWFDCTEPSLATLLQGKQGVQGAYALVRSGSSTSNLLEPSRTTSSQR